MTLKNQRYTFNAILLQIYKGANRNIITMPMPEDEVDEYLREKQIPDLFRVGIEVHEKVMTQMGKLECKS